MPWCKALMEHFLKGIERHWWCNNPNEKIKKSSLLSLILTLPSSKCSFSTWTLWIKNFCLCLEYVLPSVKYYKGFRLSPEWLSKQIWLKLNVWMQEKFKKIFWSSYVCNITEQEKWFKNAPEIHSSRKICLYSISKCSREVLQILPYF